MGVSTYQLSKDFGLRFEAIKAIEEGSANYTIDKLLAYTNALNQSINFLNFNYMYQTIDEGILDIITSDMSIKEPRKSLYDINVGSYTHISDEQLSSLNEVGEVSDIRINYSGSYKCEKDDSPINCTGSIIITILKVDDGYDVLTV